MSQLQASFSSWINLFPEMKKKVTELLEDFTLLYLLRVNKEMRELAKGEITRRLTKLYDEYFIECLSAIGLWTAKLNLPETAGKPYVSYFEGTPEKVLDFYLNKRPDVIRNDNSIYLKGVAAIDCGKKEIAKECLTCWNAMGYPSLFWSAANYQYAISLDNDHISISHYYFKKFPTRDPDSNSTSVTIALKTGKNWKGMDIYTGIPIHRFYHLLQSWQDRNFWKLFQRTEQYFEQFGYESYPGLNYTQTNCVQLIQLRLGFQYLLKVLDIFQLVDLRDRWKLLWDTNFEFFKCRI
jgi:hypothetical protein